MGLQSGGGGGLGRSTGSNTCAGPSRGGEGATDTAESRLETGISADCWEILVRRSDDDDPLLTPEPHAFEPLH